MAWAASSCNAFAIAAFSSYSCVACCSVSKSQCVKITGVEKLRPNLELGEISESISRVQPRIKCVIYITFDGRLSAVWENGVLMSK